MRIIQITLHEKLECLAGALVEFDKAIAHIRVARVACELQWSSSQIWKEAGIRQRQFYWLPVVRPFRLRTGCTRYVAEPVVSGQ